MITLITNETIKRSVFSSSTFIVDCILSTLILFIIINQKFIQVSCSKNLSFIQGSPIKCANEGQLIKVPFLPKDPCNISCKCVAGEVTCQRESCFGFEGGGRSGLSGSGLFNSGGFGSAKASVYQNGVGSGSVSAIGINNNNRNKVNSNHQQQLNNKNGFGVCKIDSNPSRLLTFDGFSYKYIGRFNYVATRDCSKKIFSVHLVNTDSGIKVRISQSSVKIGRKEINLPYVKLGVLSVIRDGPKIIVRSNIGIRVTWNRHDTTQIFIPRSYKGQVCGLCGNFNGNPKDDLKTKRGLRSTDLTKFFNSWKVGGHRSTKDVIVLKLYQYTRLRTKKKKIFNMS
ncbi:BMP-binding endothelial regulator protein-like isoform X2 [Panonychus citri]|uniref:BMP-binding endothelial regulator protein-like isoform X2 n=1 Tax=Panonychus citri TaxID=50023 RepID=UPI002307D37B|nr:BMP-binding endothelial regulator protein-like isoform X2 [Panonychus citri]